MRWFVVCGDRGIAPDGTKGASVHLRSFATALATGGHDVTAFTAREGWFPTARCSLAGAASVVAEADDGGVPDVVYERYALGHDAGLEAARRLGRPFVLEVNAPLVEEATRFRPHSVEPEDAAVEARLFCDADLVVTVSEPLRRHVAMVRGADAGTAVVGNGCDPALFPHPAPLSSQDRPTIVFLGHPKPWHGAGRLAGVVAALHRRGIPARLLVVGGGPGADAVVEQAGSLGVGDAVEVTGSLAHEAAAARLSDGLVAVAPYPPEPFFYFSPLKVVEAMAAGLPVVTTDQGDLAATVADGGVVVPPDDDGALTDAVAMLLTDHGRRRATGARARERALTQHTWATAATRVTGLVGDLLATRVAP